jgi:hypothetical protein
VTDSIRGELLTMLLLELGTYGTSEDPVVVLRELKRRERALREAALKTLSDLAALNATKDGEPVMLTVAVLREALAVGVKT